MEFIITESNILIKSAQQIVKTEKQKMEVLIDNRQNKYRITITLEKIKKTAAAILNVLECPDGELSILIVDDPQIEILNQEYLNRKGPTNVIAFPMREGDFGDIAPYLLGDVVISAETAYREGEASGTGMEKRFIQLLLHGILHLFGFDHENSKEETRKMEQKSDEILKIIEDMKMTDS